MGRLEDRVVDSVFAKFNALPSKSKPRVLPSGVEEWVPLSGIVIVEDDDVTCVSLGTGMKCLPASNHVLLAKGNVLHDWHAEVVALRAFNHFLIEEVRLLASCPDFESTILRRRASNEALQVPEYQPFVICEGLKIMMYCSEAPCGDASMELVMEAQDDATPWLIASQDEGTPAQLLGRGSFSQLGIVRRKPSRGDSPPTLSKSCSDKLALKQCTSLLSSPTSVLVSPANAYLDTLILPLSQYRSTACERSFGAKGRMRPVASQIWSGSYAFNPFNLSTTKLDFKYSRRNAGTSLSGGTKGCNISAVWNPHIQETLINGVLQGRKQTDPRRASALSRSRALSDFIEIDSKLSLQRLRKDAMIYNYQGLKRLDALEDRRQVKNMAKDIALKGWGKGSDYALADGDLGTSAF